jgi:hypothetical protein
MRFRLLPLLLLLSPAHADPQPLILRNAMCEVTAQADPFPRVTGFRLRNADANVLSAAAGHPEWSGVRIEYLSPAGHTAHSALPGMQAAKVSARTERFLRLEATPDPVTRLALTVELELDESLPLLRVSGLFQNTGTAPVTLAPWFIALAPYRGSLLVPWGNPADSPGALRSLHLWGDAPQPAGIEWEKSALRIDLTKRQADAPVVKLGIPYPAGTCAQLTPSHALLLWMPPAPGPRPDRDTGIAIYLSEPSSSGYVEMETVGPLTEIAPGATHSATSHLRIVGADKFPASATAEEHTATLLKLAR